MNLQSQSENEARILSRGQAVWEDPMKNNGLRCCAMLGCVAMFSLVARAELMDSDKTFLKVAAQSDVNEIKLSQLAETKALSAQAKAFAKKMVTDHQMLEVKMKPFADAAGLTAPSDVDSEHQAELDKLNGLSGPEFDKEYMSAMAMDHHKALDAFTTEESTTQDAKFKATVKQGMDVVARHTKMADAMQTKL
jgi:putative membrane protein